jgi:hypothetical protein
VCAGCNIIFDAVAKISKLNLEKTLAPNTTYMSVHDNLEKEQIENLIFLKDLAEAGKIKPGYR